jgi:hypothetical protein
MVLYNLKILIDIQRTCFIFHKSINIYSEKKLKNVWPYKKILQLHRLIYTVFICGKMKTESGKLITSKNPMKNLSWPSSATVCKISSYYLQNKPHFISLRHIATYYFSTFNLQTGLFVSASSKGAQKKRCTLILDALDQMSRFWQ